MDDAISVKFKMEIEYQDPISNDILNTPSDAICIPVNCIGVLGAGLALQFKEKYPFLENIYKNLCETGKLTVNAPCLIMFTLDYKRNIFIMFPTKYDWRKPSKLEWIENGLISLKNNLIRVKNRNIKNTPLNCISFPKLGCGLGGLKWDDVHKLMIKEFSTWESLEIVRKIIIFA